MLCLTRKSEESITLTLPTDPTALATLAGAKITVLVCGITRGQASIGIVAGRSIEIVRTELLESTAAPGASGHEDAQ